MDSSLRDIGEAFLVEPLDVAEVQASGLARKEKHQELGEELLQQTLESGVVFHRVAVH
jgi:hypothetical protein